MDKPAIILIPGIMGSNLSVPSGDGRNRVWLDLSDLARGRMKKLQWDARDVLPDSVVDSAYAKLAAYLRKQGHHVIPYPYDWRLSLSKAAAGLKELVEKRLQHSKQPIRLLAHSMGGLVARQFIGQHGQSWKKVVDGGGRLVQVGTPNGGSYLIPYLLHGQEDLLKMLALVDFRNSKKDWVGWIARYPGVLEMTPQAADRDFFKAETWKPLGMIELPHEQTLADAGTVVAQFGDVDLSQHPVIYVAGKADKTPVVLPGKREFSFSPDGDGRVLWSSGIPKGIEPWYVNAKHGSLCDHQPAFEGLLELVAMGTTSKLQKKPPVRAATPRGEGRFATGDIEVFPDQDALERAVLCMDEPELQLPVTVGAAASCKVLVTHGDLGFASHPVMCGHYVGDPIVHAEKALDQHCDLELSRRHQLGLYPGEIGTHEILLRRVTDEQDQTAPADTHDGAIIVGLGMTGSLTPGGLTKTIEEALVRYALVADGNPELKVSSLLIGSGETGFSVRASIEATLTAVRLANARLGNASRKSARIAEVEFIEIYQDRALQALHVLCELEGVRYRGFEVLPKLIRSDSGRLRASVREVPGWWAPLSILRDEDRNVLKFLASGHRARAVELKLPVQKALVEQLTVNPLDSEGSNVALRQALFELLVHRDLKNTASDGTNLLIVLDPYSAQFPWEMLADRHSDEEFPVSVAAGMIRKLTISSPSRVTHPGVRQALVVGDPPSSLPELPGAENEAKLVTGYFGRDWNVVRQIRNDAERQSSHAGEISAASITSALLNHDYRILHLAGHGIYDPADPLSSGMVIGDKPGSDGYLLLTPNEISQMRQVPELVFINCCHLGKVDAASQPFHLLAANLATQFIQQGVKAVVAAGWAVADDDAVTFAREFYGKMFQGATFGEAVLAARRAVYSSGSGSNTWAAYQCYGDPGFSLLMDLEVRKTVTSGRWSGYVDPVEVIVELNNLASNLKVTRDPEGRQHAEKQTGHIRDVAASRGWLEDGRVVRELARVYHQLDLLPESLDYYERALSIEGAGVSVEDLERMANMRARLVLKRVDAGTPEPPDSPTNLQELQRAIQELEYLIKQGRTAERYSMLASAHKIRARLRRGVARRRSLIEMVKAYEAASELIQESADQLYSRINAMTGVLVLDGLSGKDKDLAGVQLANKSAFGKQLKEVQAQAEAAARSGKTFWPKTYPLDAAVLELLSRNNDASSTEWAALESRYRELFRKFGSPTQHDSVVKQMRLLATYFKWSPGSRRSRDAAKIRAAKAIRLKELAQALD